MKLIGRGKLTYNWIPECESLLDVGCASGYFTRYYAEKCKKVVGIDPNENLIKEAKKINKIEFKVGDAEDLKLKEKFDVVVFGDVLEHVKDEKKSLEEIYNVLNDNGVLILTVPHKGLFGFMDVDNYSYYARTKFYKLYRLLYKLRGKDLPKDKPGYVEKHRHYSLKEIEKLLEGKFEIRKVFKSGLLGAFTSNLRLIVRWLFNENVELKLKKKLEKVNEVDYFIKYGRFSDNLAVYAVKLK